MSAGVVLQFTAQYESAGPCWKCGVEAVEVSAMRPMGPRWFVVCKGCHVVAGVYDCDPLASGEGDPRVELPAWYETESGEKWRCCESFELTVVGPCKVDV